MTILRGALPHVFERLLMCDRCHKTLPGWDTIRHVDWFVKIEHQAQDARWRVNWGSGFALCEVCKDIKPPKNPRAASPTRILLATPALRSKIKPKKRLTWF